MAWTREQMCERASRELEDGFYVNLGIGMPTLVANYISEKNKCIKVENSKYAIFIPKYENKDIWCLTTASKQIHIADTVFCDYDDVTIEDCNYLFRTMIFIDI